MKLKEFNPDNSASQRGAQGSPSVRMHIKTGLIGFTTAAVEKLGMSTGDKLVFLQDEDDEENWYVERSPKGFEFRNSKGTGQLFTNNAKVVRQICGETHATSVKFLIAGQPTVFGKRVLWGIIRIKEA